MRLISDPICNRCKCPFSHHCIGGVTHPWREKDGGAKGHIGCEYKHCENPMCSCVEFVPPGIKIPRLGVFINSPYADFLFA